MRRDLSAIMALVAVASLSLPAPAQSVWQDRPRPKRRPHIQRMVGGTDTEIHAWNEAVELRRAIKKGLKS